MQNGADVVVVGGGFAGLATALTTARASGATVVLLEGQRVGSNNPTPVTFADVVDRFDLQDHVRARYTRFSFHSALGKKSSHSYGEPSLVALDYRGACVELLRRAQAAGSVELVTAQASSLRRVAGDLWKVRTADGHVITTPLVVDASGVGLFASRALNLPGPRMFSHCFGELLVGCPVPDPGEITYFTPTNRFGSGGGWFYPLDEGCVSFGCAVLSSDPTYPAEAVQQTYRRAKGEFQPYASWLAGSCVDHVEIGTIPVCPPRRFVYDGLMLVGDAAGQATIWSCMGSEIALVSGVLAGQAAVKAYQERNYSRATLGLYQRRWDQAYGRMYRQGALLAPVSWGQGEVRWNDQVDLVKRLSPEQMLARLRHNWPLLPLWKIVFIRAYDVAGRMRRGLMARIRDNRVRGET